MHLRLREEKYGKIINHGQILLNDKPEYLVYGLRYEIKGGEVCQTSSNEHIIVCFKKMGKKS